MCSDFLFVVLFFIHVNAELLGSEKREFKPIELDMFEQSKCVFRKQESQCLLYLL